MRFDPGCSDLQRKLAANEDAACAIASDWKPGNAESSGAWQVWLATHLVSRDWCRGRLGMDPIIVARNPSWLGLPVAISEYENRSLDFAAWLLFKNGDVLGIGTYGVFWLVRVDEEPPPVLLDYPNEAHLAITPGAPRSSCCFAPIEVVLDRVKELPRVDEALENPLAMAIPTYRQCRQCKTRITL